MIKQNISISSRNKTINVQDFSPYMMRNKPKKIRPTEKLTLDQTNKQRYFLHYINSKFYLSDGFRVMNTHTVYRFKQSP